jgi:hypothetical protein
MIYKYSIEHESEWEGIVKSFQNYDIYYLPEYVKAFWYHGDGIPTLFYYVSEEIRGINVVMIRDISTIELFNEKIPINTYFDMITPYGYGGFIIEGNVTKDTMNQLNEEYTNYCYKEGIISEFVRFHPLLHGEKILHNIYNIRELGKTVAIKLVSQEQIWNNLTSKNRNMVRKAKRASIQVYWGQEPLLYDKFKFLYYQTMDRDKANQYYYFSENFFNSILVDCKYSALVFYAILDDKIIAMTIVLFKGKTMHYHLSASDANYKHLAPTNLLLYEAACFGYENGYEYFHLGGGLGSKEDSLYKFKSSFYKDGGTPYFVGEKIFHQRIYDQLVNIRSKVMSKEGDEIVEKKDTYFPLYRASV